MRTAIDHQQVFININNGISIIFEYFRYHIPQTQMDIIMYKLPICKFFDKKLVFKEIVKKQLFCD